MIYFNIKGTIKEKESNIPLPGLFVKAFDKDLLFDDLLGSAISNKRGEFEIVSELEDFQEFFEVRPDIYFKIYSGKPLTLVHSTKDAVRWSSGRISEFEIKIPWEKLYPPTEVKVVFTNDEGKQNDKFEVGESLIINAFGLRPAQTYDICIQSNGTELFTSRLITNMRP